MKHLKRYKIFTKVYNNIFESDSVIDYSKLSYSSYPTSTASKQYNFLYDGDEIGGCSIYKDNVLEYEDDLFQIGLSKEDYNKNYYYLHSIDLKEKWKGYKIGIYLLDKIIIDDNIDGLYLYATKNHPVWNKIAQKVIPENPVNSPYRVFIYKKKESF